MGSIVKLELAPHRRPRTAPIVTLTFLEASL